MNDLVHAILAATDHLTIGALYGSAGAGGVMMALATDRVLARDGIVLNPHFCNGRWLVNSFLSFGPVAGVSLLSGVGAQWKSVGPPPDGVG